MALCSKCGKVINDDAIVCAYCGRPIVPTKPPTDSSYNMQNVTWRILAFIIPILGFFYWLIKKNVQPKNAQIVGIVAIIGMIALTIIICATTIILSNN